MKDKLIVSETFDFKPSSRQYLDNGFLRVSGKAARTGVYEYLACELGIDSLPPTDIVRVYRPELEVFNADSLASYSNVDVTNDHPKSFVDADTYKNTSVGHVVSATRNGDFVDVDIIVKDKSAIADVESGKTQLSPGYTAVYVAEDGVAPCGTAYQFKQTAIDVNHLAIVSRGRGGSQVRLNDKQSTNLPEKTMIKVVLDSGRSIDLEDGATAALVQDSFERLTKRAEDSESKVDTLQSTSDAQAEKITDLEGKLKAANDGEALKAKLIELASVKDSAVNIAGKSFECDSVDSMVIKRAALAMVRDSIEWTDKSDGYVDAAFEFADMDKDKKDDDEDEEKMKDMEKATDAQRRQLATDAAAVKTKTVDHSGKRNFLDSNTWKVNAGQMTKAELEAQANAQFGG